MVQGDKRRVKREQMIHDEISCIPKTQTVTYAHVIVNLWPLKADPHCSQITAGGNLINYPGELSTQTANLTTSNDVD
jgi:hypothetical protein